MEERIVTKNPQKSECVQVQNQGDPDCFFDFHGIAHAEFLPHAKLLTRTSTKTSRDASCAQWERKGEDCGKQGYGYSIMTML